MESKKKKTIIICGIAVAILVAALVIIAITKKASQSAGFNPRKRQGGSTITTVRSVEATTQTLNDYVITNGEVESQSAVEVFPSMGGKVAQINVMLGSHVNRGDVIARIDPSEPGTRYALSPVEAPISGSIVSSPLKIGTTVTTNSAVTMIGDIDNLQISCSIPERYVAELKIGLDAEITLEAYPGVIFSASVSRISPVVDSSTRTKEIILNFDKKDSRINAGMFAKIKLYTTKYSGELVVPSDAVVTNDDGSAYLFVVNDNKTVSRREVKTGKSVDSQIQVIDNLVQGERVVYEGMLSLSDGATVNDLSTVDDANAVVSSTSTTSAANATNAATSKGAN